MNQRTIAALAELTGALYEEAGEGDVTLVLPVKTWACVLPPAPQDEAGLMEYVVHVQGGTVRFRLEGA